MIILGQNLKKFEISSNFVTLKADIYETMHFQKIFHKDKSSQNELFILRCMFLQKRKKSLTLLKTCGNN